MTLLDAPTAPAYPTELVASKAIPAAGLTTERLAEIAAAFDRDGYYIARGLFTPADVKHILDTFMTANRNGPIPGVSEIKDDYHPADPLAFYPRMIHPHNHPTLEVGRVAGEYLIDRRIEAVLTACMREQPIAVQSMFYFKPPGARGQELHQDNYYLRVRPKTCCAAWIAVDDADAENGGMKVVPGTQHMEVVCPDKADTKVSFTVDYVPVPDGLEAVQVELKAGDVLFFNGSLVHGSTPNTSKTRFRRSLINHYVPESTTEMSHFYTEVVRTFDGHKHQIPPTAWGGPCGTADAGKIH